jgi:hypothetical protein
MSVGFHGRAVSCLLPDSSYTPEAIPPLLPGTLYLEEYLTSSPGLRSLSRIAFFTPSEILWHPHKRIKWWLLKLKHHHPNTVPILA